MLRDVLIGPFRAHVSPGSGRVLLVPVGSAHVSFCRRLVGRYADGTFDVPCVDAEFVRGVCVLCSKEEGGHEATDIGLAYAPVSQAHGNHHIVQCFSLLHCSADQFCTTPGGCWLCFGLGHLYFEVSSHPPPSHGAG